MDDIPEETAVSWLKKIIGKFNAEEAERAAKDLINAMPAAACVTARASTAAPARPEAEPEEVDPDNPFKQRRYFVKQGRFVDYEEQSPRASAPGDESEEIRDRPPVDLKTVFPRLSLR